jgi:hypothetical protein
VLLGSAEYFLQHRARDVACFAAAGAGNDYQKDLQFRKLNAQKDIIEVTVTRGGQTLVRAPVQDSILRTAGVCSSQQTSHEAAL